MLPVLYGSDVVDTAVPVEESTTYVFTNLKLPFTTGGVAQKFILNPEKTVPVGQPDDAVRENFETVCVPRVKLDVGSGIEFKVKLQAEFELALVYLF